MKKLVYIMAIGLSSTGLMAQTSEIRTVSDFTKINAEGAAEVIITQGEPTQVKVTSAEGADMSKIITEVKDNMLHITTKGSMNEDFKIYITFKTLEALSSSGAAYIKSDSTFNSEKVYLESAGASRIKLDVICKSIESNASGASTISLTGATESHLSFVNGAASLKAYKLSTVNTEITTSGAASGRVSVNNKFTANASGASSIRYMGNPEDRIINVSASSNVKHVDGDENVRLNDTDTSKTHYHRRYGNWDGGKYSFHWDNDFHHWAGIELNLNGLIGENGSTSLPASSDYMSINYGTKSLSWNLNLLQKNFHIYKNYVNLVTGLGFGFNSYQLKNPVRLNADSSFTYYSTDSAITFSKNKLKTSYLQVPLMIEFNTSKNADKAFHIGAGVIGGYKLGSKTLRTYEINGYEVEERRKDDYNINPFKLDATVRIGYGAFTMFGTYGLTTLFENNKGPKVSAFTVGVRIIPF